ESACHCPAGALQALSWRAQQPLTSPLIPLRSLRRERSGNYFWGDVYPGWRLRLTRGYCLLPQWGKSDGLAQGHGWTAPATTFPPAHSKARHGLRWQSEARHRFFQFFTLGPLYPPHYFVPGTNY